MLKTVKDPRKIIEETIDLMNASLKKKFPGLTGNMINAVREQNMQMMKKLYTNTISENKLVKTELGSARKIIWALVRTMGGIKVPDGIMAVADGDENQISARYDGKNSQTVFMAKESDSRIIM